MVKTSVILCTRNRPDDITAMLHSLKAQTAVPSEIIVVDSSNTPIIEHPSFRNIWHERYFPACKLIYKYTQPGLTYQRNQGVKHASGDIVYFFDDDVILSSTYLEQMNNAFTQNPHYAGGMGAVIPRGSYKPIVNALRALFLLQRDYSHGQFTLSGMPTHPYGTSRFRSVEVVGGCCMAFRSYVFIQYSFDENLRFYGFMEDCDFSWRVSRKWPLFFNPQAMLEHKVSPLNRDSWVENRAMFIANYSYLFFKNFYPHSPLAIAAYLWSITGLFLEAIFIVRDKQWIIGYYRGLRHALRHKATLPYQAATSSSGSKSRL
jgi:GT2 family glycosyltransferase